MATISGVRIKDIFFFFEFSLLYDKVLVLTSGVGAVIIFLKGYIVTLESLLPGE